MQKHIFNYDISKIKYISCFQELYNICGVQDFLNKYQEENPELPVDKLIDIKTNEEDCLKLRDLLVNTYSNYDVVWRDYQPEFYLKPIKKQGNIASNYLNAISDEFNAISTLFDDDTDEGTLILFIYTEQEYADKVDNAILEQGKIIQDELPAITALADKIKEKKGNKEEEEEEDREGE